MSENYPSKQPKQQGYIRKQETQSEVSKMPDTELAINELEITVGTLANRWDILSARLQRVMRDELPSKTPGDSPNTVSPCEYSRRIRNITEQIDVVDQSISDHTNRLEI